MDEDQIVALFKLGKKEHMHSLLYEGVVYMETFSYFASSESDEARRDRHEGALFAKDMDGWSFDIEEAGSWQNAGTIQGMMVARSQALGTSNIYCLHARTTQDYGTPFELGSLGFGDSFVLFTDGNEFLRRLRDAASTAGQSLEIGPVEYIAHKGYSGKMGPFRKFADYRNQREFRIAAYPGTGKPLALRLGDLSDIALMGPTDRRLRLDPIKQTKTECGDTTSA